MITVDEMDDGYATFVAILGPLSIDVEDLDIGKELTKKSDFVEFSRGIIADI